MRAIYWTVFTSGEALEQLSKVVGENLRRLRAAQGLSLESLARASGVSKSRLGQIERGEANPSISTVWQIANALRVEFSTLVSSTSANTVLVSRSRLEPVTADAGRCRTYALFAFDPALGFEVYLTEVDPGGHLHAEPHLDGTTETLTVFSGTLAVSFADEEHTVAAWEAIRFMADTVHEYRNLGDDVVTCGMVLAYAHPEKRARR